MARLNERLKSAIKLLFHRIRLYSKGKESINNVTDGKYKRLLLLISRHTKRYTSNRFKASNMSLKNQLIMVFVTVSIIPIIFMGAIIYNRVHNEINSAQNNMLYAYSEGAKNTVDLTISSANNVLKSLSSQSDLSVLLEDVNYDGIFETPIRLNNVLLSLKNAVKSSDKLYETIFVSDKKGNIIADGSAYKEQYMRLNISDTEYFQEIKAGEKFVIGNPTISKATGHYTIPVALSIDNLAGSVGVMVIMFDLEKFTQPISKMEVGQSGYVYIVNEHGNYIYNKEKQKLMQPVDNEVIKKEVDNLRINNMLANNLGEYQYGKSKIVAFYDKSSNMDWIVVAVMDKKEYQNSINQIRSTIMIVTMILALICLVVSYKYSKKLAIPIRKLADLMEDVAKGKMDVKAELHTSHEIGILNDSFNTMLSDLKMLITNISTASNEVTSASEQLTDISQNAFDYTTQVSSIIDQISEGTSQQENHIETGVLKINALANTIESVNDSAHNINDASKHTSEIAKRGLEQLGLLNNTSDKSYAISIKVRDEVENLNQEISKIGKILNTISGVSRQTNLLALNASIESARAGDAGKGFGVVASEIRKLAEQVSNQTGYIQQIINELHKKAEHVHQVVEQNDRLAKEQKSAVQDTEKAFRIIYDTVTDMNARILDITTSIEKANEQKHELITSVSGISEIADSTARTSETALEASNNQFEALQLLKNQAESLDILSNKLKGCLATFNKNK